MAKDYYEILGVSQQADANEIKRAYRKLAVRFHPDKNPDPMAAEMFRKITEAYEILGDVSNRHRYDAGSSFPSMQEEVESTSRRYHRDPAYRRKRPSHVRVKSEKERTLEMMASFLPVTHKIILISLFVCGLLTADILLPATVDDEIIVDSYMMRTRGRNSSSSSLILITDHGNSVHVPFFYEELFKRGMTISIERTRILSVTTTVIAPTEAVEIRKSIYRNFSFAPIMLLMTAMFGYYFRKRIDYAFNAGVVSLMLLILTIVIYSIVH